MSESYIFERELDCNCHNTFQFKALRSRQFQHEFDRVNLHRLTSDFHWMMARLRVGAAPVKAATACSPSLVPGYTHALRVYASPAAAAADAMGAMT
jgi:hypothetical protein